MPNESRPKPTLNRQSVVGNDNNKNHSAAYMEEMSIENLVKKALKETLRDGGAFARENSDQFKQ